MRAADHVRALVAAAPAGSVLSVPRDWLAEILDNQEDPSAVVVDLGVDDLAAMFKKSPGTIRAWLDAGRFPGSYKLRGRYWRVPVASVQAFQLQERSASPGGRARPVLAPKPVDLGAWRRAR